MSKFISELKLDARDELKETIYSTGFKYVLEWLEAAQNSLKEDVLRYDLSAGNDRELALIKARAEGAAKLVKSFKIQVQKAKSVKID